MKNKNNNIIILFIILTGLILTSCSKDEVKKKEVALVTDSEKITENTRSGKIFNGLNFYEEEISIDTKESKSRENYLDDIDRMISDDKHLIISTSFLMNDAILTASNSNPEINFLIFDSIINSPNEKLVSIAFKTNESSFLVGYLAGLETKTNHIAYVGFEKGLLSDMYEYGFKSGVLEAAKELNKNIYVEVKYVDSMSNYELGKDIADAMYDNNTDIIYQTVGYTGVGIIESAKNNKKFVIGYDIDQSYLAPNNILTSSIKNYAEITKYYIDKYLNNNFEKENGLVGLKEDAVGITRYDENALYSKQNYNKVLSKKELIKNGDIQVPMDKESWGKYYNK